jgi:rubrerythrin
MSHSAPDERPPRGALQELAEDDGSRKTFFKMVGGAGAAGAFSVFLAACGSGKKEKTTSSQHAGATSEGTRGDVKILNYALTLEHLEVAFYKAVVSRRLFKGAQAAMIKKFADQEAEHEQTLTAAVKKLGGTPAAKPKPKLPALTGAKQVLELASTFENLGAAAYLGQAHKIQSREVLATALAIHTVEARHAAALNMLLGKSIVPDGPFAEPASMNEVMSMVKPFIAG